MWAVRFYFVIIQKSEEEDSGCNQRTCKVSTKFIVCDCELCRHFISLFYYNTSKQLRVNQTVVGHFCRPMIMTGCNEISRTNYLIIIVLLSCYCITESVVLLKKACGNIVFKIWCPSYTVPVEPSSWPPKNSSWPFPTPVVGQY